MLPNAVQNAVDEGRFWLMSTSTYPHGLQCQQNNYVIGYRCSPVHRQGLPYIFHVQFPNI